MHWDILVTDKFGYSVFYNFVSLQYTFTLLFGDFTFCSESVHYLL